MLLVSYHFPPSGRIGARRWQHMAEHLADRGWALDVLMVRPRPDDPAFNDDDWVAPPGLRSFVIDDSPHAARVLEDRLYQAWTRIRDRLPRVGANGAGSSADVDGASVAERPESFHRDEVRWDLAHPRGWMRLYWSWLVRAEERCWARRAAASGIRLAQEVDYDAVISSGPPHEHHLAGLLISRGAGLPFVMDVRDAWAHTARLPEHLATAGWLASARRQEARAVDAASMVVANTGPLADAMRASYPAAARRIVTVRNGCDDGPAQLSAKPSRFSIRFAGSVYMGRDPMPLLEAVARLVHELGLGADDLGVDLVGHLPVDQLRARAEALGIGDHLSIGGWQSRDTVCRFLAEAHVLVTLPWCNEFAIPGKLYEYIGYPAWILALSDGDRAVEGLLADTPATVVDASDVEAIARVLRDRYADYRRGELPRPLAGHARAFGRRAQTRRFARWFEVLVG